jgi:hypothetical protein
MSIDVDRPGHGAPPIPGAYERNTLTHRQPGSIGMVTSVALPNNSSSMAPATITEREREGGGAPRERRRKANKQSRTGPALRATEGNSSWLTGGSLWFQILRLARR